jgi:anti-sigma B factor antagonist
MGEDVVAGDTFTISGRHVDADVVLVAIAGELDVETVPQATAFLADATARSPRHLVLDLSEVTFLTSSGIGLLITAESDDNGINGQLHLIGVTDNRAVHQPLAQVGLLGQFDVAPDLETLRTRLSP